MFDSPADAANALLDYLGRPHVEIVADALVPAIVFAPSVDGALPGQTRLGGTPDVPEGFVWPRPPAPEDPETIASRANPDTARELRAHLSLKLPYAFIAQVDLAEAAPLQPASSPLPSEGRLLFFYDMAIGPWDTGTRTAKVIWDRTPAEQIHPLPMPEDLAAAAAREADEWAEIAADFEREKGEPSGGGTNYGAPGRAATLKQIWRLPSPYSIEIDALPDLAAAAMGETTDPALQEDYAAYEEALEAFGDRYRQEPWQHQQLLGSPLPEQDDPRFDAVVASDWGKQHLSREEWQQHREDIFRRARDWTLLLQIDIRDWMRQPFAQGTVYFVIRRDDLDRRNFGAVVAVYQQT